MYHYKLNISDVFILKSYIALCEGSDVKVRLTRKKKATEKSKSRD